jgi:DNA (cytosine-5)-methyltransferase 1
MGKWRLATNRHPCLSQTGFETVLFCESDPYAKEVLKAKFPRIDLHPDVRSLKEIPECDVIAAGFPCQDLSQAGNKNGINGDSSRLVTHVFRFLQNCDLKDDGWLLIENVPYMLRLNRGAAMKYLVTELENYGFKWAYRIVDARAFGLPQRRPRVVLLASRANDPRFSLFDQTQIAPELDGKPKDVLPGHIYGFYWTEGSRGVGWACEAVPPIKAGSTIGIPSPPAIWSPNDDFVGLPDIRDLERIQGLPQGWTKPAETVDKKGGRARWRLVGNAVSTRLAKWIGQRIQVQGYYDDSRDVSVNPPSWPQAAWGVAGQVFSVDVSQWPKQFKQNKLSKFLKFPLRPLSRRATLGFLSRTKVCTNVVYSQTFIKSLQRYVERNK